MYLAEIRGKLSRRNENKEDVLTSNIFSFFKYTDRAVFLRPFLQSIGLEITPDDAQQAEFDFWPTYPDRTEPDLIIQVGNYYLLIEAKYLSDFEQEITHERHQLRREIENGLQEADNLGKEFKILIVTAHHFQPEILNQIKSEHDRDLQWINWQQIAYFLYSVLENHPNIPFETTLFAEDLYQLLLKKNLRNYEGVKPLKDLPSLQEQEGAIFFDATTASYRGDFIGFPKAIQMEQKIKPPPKHIFFLEGGYKYWDVLVKIRPIRKEQGSVFYEGGQR